MRLKAVVLILSIFYIIALSIMAYVNFCYSRAQTVKGEGAFYKALQFLNVSESLNSLNSDFPYAKFNILNDKFNKARGLTYREKIELLDHAIIELKKAIALQPTQASYHMFYGLALFKRYPFRKGAIYELARGELNRACELKPGSKRYQAVYSKF